MTSNKFKVIEGGRDAIERNLVIALFEGNIAEVDKLSAQLEAIAEKPVPKLGVLQNRPLIDDSLNKD
jgi:hypothetical protein